ncbi:M1 family metallopeptidase [bacterium]|jgi:aminopeptidase N|nr:M1 family metallopeptidase [bacterium]MBT6293758.1 M1 family metallopeptidase [bacterium]
MAREFKYYPEDFGDLPVKVMHMDLDFDVYDDHTIVESTLHFKSLIENLEILELNAKNLEILEVSDDYEYLKEKDILKVSFKSPLNLNQEYKVKTKVITRPSWNVLEGMYYDISPKGCPCTQITQCQQWGFQRITPCIDDMTAKCTYYTTITADSRYTDYLTNGDLASNVLEVSKGRVKVEYANNVTPMATYLFFLGVGTYATFTKEFEYPNGDIFELALLVPPNSDASAAEHSLEVLYDSIMWVHLFTGPNTYENFEISSQIYELCKQREVLKKEGEKLDLIRAQINELIESNDLVLGYKYTGTVYREIGMQNSDFGGMENVGNTTITTNRIMPHFDMSDGGYEYMVKVKVHEFYHNLNGSEVTGRSPFEIWLNEAVTVFIEQLYSAYVFGERYERLDTVLGFLAPTSGTFALDMGVASMPIEPAGFNDTNELITGVTYVKAPEFVRMIETILGKENFVKALDLYHTKFKHSNASSSQWIDCMQEYTEVDLHNFSRPWLKNTCHPIVDVNVKVENESLLLTLKQTNFKDDNFWHLPLSLAVFDFTGNKIFENEFYIDEPTAEIEIPEITDYGFISINRNFSFFGQVLYKQDLEDLYLQAKMDDDVVNRYLAFKKIFDLEKTQILEGSTDAFSDRFLDFYMSILEDQEIYTEFGTLCLSNFESVDDDRYKYQFDVLFKLNKKFKEAIANKFEDRIFNLFNHVYALSLSETELEYHYENATKIKLRQVKNLCLSILASTKKDEYLEIVKDQYLNANNATDKMSAFRIYMNSLAKDKYKILDMHEEYASKNLVAWESFLYSVSSLHCDDVIEIIQRVEKHPNFNLTQANDQRGLFVAFAHNKKISLLTNQGRDYLKTKLLELAKINEYSAGRILNVFGALDKIDVKHSVELIKILVDVQKELDQASYPSVFNTISRIVKGSVSTYTEYEKRYL